VLFQRPSALTLALDMAIDAAMTRIRFLFFYPIVLYEVIRKSNEARKQTYVVEEVQKLV